MGQGEGGCGDQLESEGRPGCPQVECRVEEFEIDSGEMEPAGRCPGLLRCISWCHLRHAQSWGSGLHAAAL